ncbi:tyrosine-type recombinase/integrase [Streptomyces sp. NPDC001222]|uniref:tyrosine-type recombinase/integrase n=1 Tax=Streptomyces sp. NPDC001222 TaxID=3364548 RepID=UPI0036B61C71
MRWSCLGTHHTEVFVSRRNARLTVHGRRLPVERVCSGRPVAHVAAEIDARHGCATLLTAAGVAPRVVMEILGHSQIAVTMNGYAHVVQDTQREAVSHMDRLLTRRLQRE